MTRLTIAKAAKLAQQGCRVTFHPDGSITVEKSPEPPPREVDARMEIVL